MRRHWFGVLAAGAVLASLATASPASAVLVDQADMNAAVTASPNPAGTGGTITYAIRVVNSGPTVALSPVVATAVPGTTKFTSFAAPTGWTVNTPPAGGTGAISATRGGFASGATATFTLVVTVNHDAGNGSNIVMAATASSRLPDPNPGNNRSEVTVQVNNTADLVVAAVDSPDPAGPGGQISYTLGVANNGPALARDVSLRVDVPGSTAFASFAAPAGWSATVPAVGQGGTITATRPDLAAGATATFTLVVAVAPGTAEGTTINLNVSGGTSTGDPNGGNNSTNVTTGIANAADLSVSASGVPAPVDPGGTITYTIAVKDNGPVGAASAALSAITPANTVFTSFSAPEGWAVNAPAAGGTGTVTATRPSLAAGATATFTLVVTVNPGTAAGATITLTANTASSTTDPNAQNNTATANVDVRTPEAGGNGAAPSGSADPGRSGDQLASTGFPNIRVIGLTTLVVGAGLLIIAVARSTYRRRQGY